MRIIEQPATTGAAAPALAVLLPGALQRPEDLIAAGFVEAVRQRKLALDLILVDPELRFIGDAADGSALAQLDRALNWAACRQRYQTIWLGGISIGGLMALNYVARSSVGRTRAAATSVAGTESSARTDVIDGLCLLSPYPGSRMLTAEITAAGGIDLWSDAAAASEDGERQNWQWLKVRRSGAHSLPVYLGYGTQDRFSDGHHMMAQALMVSGCNKAGGDKICAVAGGHDWPAWLQLWENFLERVVQNAADTRTANHDPASTRGQPQ